MTPEAARDERLATEPLELRLTAVVYGGEGTNLYELRRPEGGNLPPFTAGAHVDLHLPNGMVRQYSIASPQGERDRYLLGIKLDGGSRGGSRYVHDTLRVGTLLRVGPPRNNFPLVEDAPFSLLVAGGIGLTPMLCMVDRLRTLNRPWSLHYAVRRRAEAMPLAALAAATHLHVDEEQSGVMDVAALVAAAPGNAHLYCCGPAPMLAAFEAACATRSPTHVHIERFTAPEDMAPAAGDGYRVELRRSNRQVTVVQGQTLLEALLGAGIKVQVSCEQGICGTCETRVIAGTPDHRDMILSESEKAANDVMMVCCSGSLGPTLVLDL